jgi:hypothetical protein
MRRGSVSRAAVPHGCTHPRRIDHRPPGGAARERPLVRRGDRSRAARLVSLPPPPPPRISRRARDPRHDPGRGVADAAARSGVRDDAGRAGRQDHCPARRPKMVPGVPGRCRGKASSSPGIGRRSGRGRGAPTTAAAPPTVGCRPTSAPGQALQGGSVDEPALTAVVPLGIPSRPPTPDLPGAATVTGRPAGRARGGPRPRPSPARPRCGGTGRGTARSPGTRRRSARGPRGCRSSARPAAGGAWRRAAAGRRPGARAGRRTTTAARRRSAASPRAGRGGRPARPLRGSAAGARRRPGRAGRPRSRSWRAPPPRPRRSSTTCRTSGRPATSAFRRTRDATERVRQSSTRVLLDPCQPLP